LDKYAKNIQVQQAARDLVMKPVRFFRLRRVGAIFVFLGIIIPGLAFFMLRPPALILSDAGSDALYGPRRVLIRQAGLSLRFFRRVKRILIAENASPEAVVFAIEEGGRPWAVLGHSRYLWGLDQYARQHPDLRVAVIREGPAPEPALSGGGPESVFADTRLNSWRAGRCAAILAGEGGGQILVFQDQENFPVNRDAFLAGLQEENGSLNPVYLNGAAGYSPWDQVRCVVLGGPADSYFNQNSQVPALLFTWMDPALSPFTVKIIGDDSPWAMAPEIFRSPGDGGRRIVPVEFSIPWGRVADRELRKRLKEAARRQIPETLPW
jgi:hypothetical protein